MFSPSRTAGRRPRHCLNPLLAGALCLGFAACGGGKSDPEKREGDSSSAARKFPTPKQIETGPDGLARLAGQSEPYTGAVILADADLGMRYFAYYFEGKLHGPEIKYNEDGRMRRAFDYEHGEKIRHREWFPNGNKEIDSTQRNGEAYGPHQTWFEDGTERWKGNFIEDLLWEGHIVDYAPGPKLMWDAIFKDGLYVSGIYPEEEQEKMIEMGLVKPEDALYPIKNAPAPKPENETQPAPSSELSPPPAAP